MATRCPSCSAPLVDGALRCRFCGADARAGQAGSGLAVSFTLAQVAPRTKHGLDLMDELGRIAPEVLAWWRAASPEERARVLEVLVELSEIGRPRRGS